MENKNWSKMYMLIIWSITLVVILGGLAYNVGGFGFSRISSSAYADYDFSNQEFSSIDVDVAAADVDIRYGDDYMVSTNISEKYRPTINVKNGKLTIQQKRTKHKLNSLKDASIEITIPKGVELETIEIDANAGDIDVDVLAGKQLIISADAGDIDLNNLVFESASISADAGNIDLKDCNLGNITVEADMGEIELENVDFENGKLSADMGNISVDGSFKELDAFCDMGSIDITTPNPNRDSMNLNVSLGSISVNGEKW